MSGSTCMYLPITELERRAWLAAADGRHLDDWVRTVANAAASPEPVAATPELKSCISDMLAAAARCDQKGLKLTAKRLRNRAAQLRAFSAPMVSP